MSLCYDFQKWTIISMVSVGIGLSVGLVLLSMQYGHGQEGNTTKLTENSSRSVITGEEFLGLSNHVKALESLLNYCFEHASDSANPVQDLVDKGLISQEFSGKTCGEIRLDHQEAQNQLFNSDINATKELEIKHNKLKEKFDSLRDKFEDAIDKEKNR